MRLLPRAKTGLMSATLPKLLLAGRTPRGRQLCHAFCRLSFRVLLLCLRMSYRWSLRRIRRCQASYMPGLRPAASLVMTHGVLC